MKALTNNELSVFCSQFALILRSGISSIEGLSILCEDTPDGSGRQLLEAALHKLQETGSLYEALESTKVFPPYMCSMVEIGELSGRLDDVMSTLAEHYKREDALSKNIKSAVTYPLVMLGLMIAVLLVLIIKVLPVFNQVFQQLGTSLTGFSGTMLEFGMLLGRYSFILIILLLAAAGLCIYFCCSPKGHSLAARFSSRFFMTKRLSEKIACSRFAGGMYLSLSSGLDIDQSLDMVSRLIAHPSVRKKIKRIQTMTAEGEGFADAVSKTGIFSGVYARMITVGFKTGAMDHVMQQIYTQYDEEIENQMDTIVSKLEPTLVAALSIIVGLILLSVMLPLMGIMSNIG